MCGMGGTEAGPDPVPAPELDPEKLQHGPPEGWGAVIGGIDDDGSLITMCGWTVDGEFHQYVNTEKIASVLIGHLQKR